MKPTSIMKPKKNISGFIENMSDNYIYIENRKLAVQDIRALIINR